MSIFVLRDIKSGRLIECGSCTKISAYATQSEAEFFAAPLVDADGAPSVEIVEFVEKEGE